jgi:putative N-acetylmannosamine-6-phosphate epimerase
MQKGIIVSIQGYTPSTTQEIAKDVINAGAVALRLDKPISGYYSIIGLHKIKKVDNKKVPFITPTLEDVKQVKDWSNYIAIDYRKLNPNLDEISLFCKENNIDVIADIATIEDYENILMNDYYYNYIATTLSVFYMPNRPNIQLINQIKRLNKKEKIIAEGNYKAPKDVYRAFEFGANNVCIGDAITNFYKLTKKYTRLVK